MHSTYVNAADVAERTEGVPAVGDQIYALARRIFPICRSITGSGVAETLSMLREYVDIECHSVPTGSQIFDWTIPPEWVVRDAYIKVPGGRKVVDFARSNLHLMNYSVPVHETMSLAALRPHIHTLPDQPDLTPYKTAYYTDTWGFCMPHDDLMGLADGDYEVVVDTEKRAGNLFYGEYLHAGESRREILFYAHICHPSLANDNCSGLAVLTQLAMALKGRANYYSYRFVFAPGTIGSLTWLSRNESRLKNIVSGLVVSCVGDGGGPNYKKSRGGQAAIDKIMPCLRCDASWTPVTLQDFSPYGYDERQFCSPGFNLPVGLLQRSAFGTFDEYHTSADNLDFIRPQHLETSFHMLTDLVEAFEQNWMPLNLSPKGEPQLGRHGLFPALGGHKTNSRRTMAYLWVLNLADGDHSLLDIAAAASIPFTEIAAAAADLLGAGLLANHGRILL